MGLFLFFLFIVVALVWYLMTHDTTPEQQQEPEKSDEDVLANANRLLALTEAATQAKESGHDDVYQAIMANTYDGPLPERRADGGWTSVFDDLRILSIAGINHRQNIVRYKGRNTVALVPEPSNEFDLMPLR